MYADGDTYEYSGKHDDKMSLVDLGTLNWTRSNNNGSWTNYMFFAKIENMLAGTKNIMLGKYQLTDIPYYSSAFPDKMINTTSSSNYLYIRDDSYTDAATFKTAMSGVMLLYEKATPTITEADPYQQIQVVDTHGTESMVDNRDVAVPMGHETHYYEDIAKKVSEMLPSPPSANGTYKLTATVSASGVAYSWQA